MKQKYLQLPLAMFCLCVVFGANAQQQTPKGIARYSGRLQEIVKPSSQQYWLDIRDEVSIKPSSFLSSYKLDMGSVPTMPGHSKKR